MKETRKFSRSINALEDVFKFLQTECKKYEIGQKIQLDIELCVEELFTNMVRHNKDTSEDIEIIFDKSGDELKLSLIDYEKSPYNITEIPELDLEDYINKKKSGGLGIHLVKKMMDDIHFEHQYGVSVITISKRLRNWMLTIEKKDNNHIKFSGRLDASQAEIATNALIIPDETLTIDMSDLTYISSMGLSVLVNTYKQLNEKGHTL